MKPFRTKTSLLKDLFCAFLLFIIALSVHLSVTKITSDIIEHPVFLQTNFLYPAVFFAAGLGMGTTDISKIPELEEFIYNHASEFDIGKIPSDTTVVPIKTVLETTHLYYLFAIGLLWRLLGVSAFVITLFAALMRAFSSIAIYGIFRIATTRAASVIGTLFICTAPYMLDNIIELRDFGKVPFILFFLFLIAYIVSTRLSIIYLLTISAVMGLLLGIGLGFRQDVLICLPPAIVTLLFFSSTKSLHVFQVRAIAVLVFSILFIVSAYPIIRGIALEGGQAPLHAFFHGISPETEGRLNFGGAAYDSLISVDPAAFAIVNVYARRSGNFDSMINEGSSEYLRAHGDKNAPLVRDPYIYFTGAKYGQFANKVIWEIIWHYPADIVTRAWRAICILHTVPEKMCVDMKRSYTITPGWFQLLLDIHFILSQHVSRYGLIYIILVMMAISAKKRSLAFYLTALFIWFAGYPTLWYELRHFFYLAFIPILAMMLCVDWLFHKFWLLYAQKEFLSFIKHCIYTRMWMRPLLNIITYITLVLIFIIVPIVLLRCWQLSQVNQFAEHLSKTSLIPIKIEEEIYKEKVKVQPSEPLPGLLGSENLPPGETAWEYVAVKFNTAGNDIPLTIHYNDHRLLYSFTQTINIYGIRDLDKGQVTLYFPVYEVFMNYGGDQMAREILRTYPNTASVINDQRPIEEQDWWHRGQFLGISFPSAYRTSFEGFYRVIDIENLSLLPIFQLPADLQHLRPYKTGPWERKLRGLPPWKPASLPSF